MTIVDQVHIRVHLHTRETVALARAGCASAAKRSGGRRHRRPHVPAGEPLISPGAHHGTQLHLQGALQQDTQFRAVATPVDIALARAGCASVVVRPWDMDAALVWRARRPAAADAGRMMSSRRACMVRCDRIRPPAWLQPRASPRWRANGAAVLRGPSPRPPARAHPGTVGHIHFGRAPGHAAALVQLAHGRPGPQSATDPRRVRQQVHRHGSQLS